MVDESFGGVDVAADRQGKSFGLRFPHLEWIGHLKLEAPELASQFATHDRSLVLSWLTRNGVTRVADLLSLDEDSVLDWHGIGVGKAARIVDAVAALDDLVLPLLSILAFPDPVEAEGLQPSVDISTVSADVDVLVAWGSFAQGASTVGEASEALTGQPLPEDVMTALRAVRSVQVCAAPQVSPVQLVSDWIGELDERDAAILRHRLVRFEPSTLDEIGSRFGVTRERIRQLEGRLVERVNTLLSGPGWTVVRWAVHQLRVGLGTYAPEQEVPILDEGGFASYEFGTLLWLAGFERDPAAGVLRRRGFSLPKPTALPMADPPVVDEVSLRRQLESEGVVPHHLDFAISALKGVRRLEGSLVLWPGNLVEKAHAVLAVRGVPMTPDEIADVIGGDFSRAGLRDRLFNAEQIVRVTKGTVGLRDWGAAEYTKVADLMARRLEEQGPTPIAELARSLSLDFGVAEASVHLYAPAPIFVLEHGVLRLRRLDEPYEPRNSPASVPGLYYVGEDVSIWHVRVDSDILRGSGRFLPPEIAVPLGVLPGTRISLDNPARNVPVSWLETSNTGPSIGSIKALAEAAEAQLGDVMRLRFDRRDRSLRCEVPVDSTTGQAPAAALAMMTGLPEATCQTRSDLADAIRSDPSLVVDALRKRGDEDVASLVELLNT